MGYLAHVVDINRTETSGPGETRVVCDFADVFPDELPGLPPAREDRKSTRLNSSHT